MYDFALKPQTNLRNKITTNYRVDETQILKVLLEDLAWEALIEDKVRLHARELVNKVRTKRIKGRGVDALMQEFKLSTEEGVALMCLAESFLRVPDKYTQNKLIADKIKLGDWKSHVKSDNFFVNASSWGLVLTGKLVNIEDRTKLSNSLIKLIHRFGEPIIRKAMGYAVGLMGNQFVMGETIAAALKKVPDKQLHGYQFSFDMLGEAALTESDAKRYLQSYIDAIHQVGAVNKDLGVKGLGISVKLSAIHPRYTRVQRERVMEELLPRLKHLFLLAKQYQIAIFIDAEESERLELSLDLLEALILDPEFKDFKGIGFVIQAYQKRAYYVIDYIHDLMLRANNKIMLRLVKGAYWDSEIKKAQVDGQSDYPVFTRKFHTDVSYLACAKKIFTYQNTIFPLFATHNAYTLAAIYQLAASCDFEFQCLYGMGETLYDNIVGKKNLNITTRVYAPVGSYDTLLAYLVRRLLENGANSSFVHQLVDKNVSVEELIASPVELTIKSGIKPNPYFNKPLLIYGNSRYNSKGLDLSDEIILTKLEGELSRLNTKEYLIKSLVAIENPVTISSQTIKNPANLNSKLGLMELISSTEIPRVVDCSLNEFNSWSKLPVSVRAAKVLQFADLLEANYSELISIITREAGKTLTNAVNEIREAVDFCRYYVAQVQAEFNNETHQALGVFIAISPWNFPLAIFVGEVISALITGNTVIAKPSMQTTLTAYFAVNLMYQAGIPKEAIQLMIGSGAVLGNDLTREPRISGVIFTGSTEVAKTINQNLALNQGAKVLIAETGGQNAMIVDSTALAEQVVQDVVASGFDSAGQRCSALRVLYLQEEVAPHIINMLKGAMQELRVGNPSLLKTDVGPVIDDKAYQNLAKHINEFINSSLMYYQTNLTDETTNGLFIKPTIFEIKSIKELKKEVFGPVIHIIRFKAHELKSVINEINSTGFGLTQGLHSRLRSVAEEIYTKIHAGNIYINRNMVGAVVGVQPFGGEGLSGTGPKAGGPNYLYRLIKPVARFNSSQLASSLNKFARLDEMIKKIKHTHPEYNEELTNLANSLKQRSLICDKINLPGPTGEENFLFYVPRGKILCVAENLLEYLRQLIYVLATNNQAVLVVDSYNQILSTEFKDLFIWVDNIVEVGNINAALLSVGALQLSNYAQELAKKDGVLIPILVAEKGEYPLALLVNERTVSINTTATGGNVELMSIIDQVN